MTFAPAQQITAALTALALHGVELPAVPTRVTVPAPNQLLLELDVSTLPATGRNELVAVLPGEFTEYRKGGAVAVYAGGIMLLTTNVTFALFTDADDWKEAR